MKSIRIGNDITIIWKVYRLGEAEDLSGKQVDVKLLDKNGICQKITYSIEENVVTIVFEGRYQRVLGGYILYLSENEGRENMTTIDYVEAFKLVAFSIGQGGSDEHGVKTNASSLEITSDISAPSNGLSAYEIAVKNGYIGTESEWLESLKGKDGQSAYEIAVAHGYVGTEEEWLESLKAKVNGYNSINIIGGEGIDVEYQGDTMRLRKKTYEYAQTTPAREWVINHNLGMFPSVSVIDSAGSSVCGEVKYIDEDNVALAFSGEFSGKAYLN